MTKVLAFPVTCTYDESVTLELNPLPCKDQTLTSQESLTTEPSETTSTWLPITTRNMVKKLQATMRLSLESPFTFESLNLKISQQISTTTSPIVQHLKNSTSPAKVSSKS